MVYLTNHYLEVKIIEVNDKENKYRQKWKNHALTNLFWNVYYAYILWSIFSAQYSTYQDKWYESVLFYLKQKPNIFFDCIYTNRLKKNSRLINLKCKIGRWRKAWCESVRVAFIISPITNGRIQWSMKMFLNCWMMISCFWKIFLKHDIEISLHMSF